MYNVKCLLPTFTLAIAGIGINPLVLAADRSEQLTIEVRASSEQGQGAALGTIKVEPTPYGLLFTPELKGLAAGLHGFHIHEHANCAPNTDAQAKVVPAGAAGGHFDPEKTGQHLGPYNSAGHLGDLPALYVNAEGVADYPVLAPKLRELAQIKKRSIMIHAGGDNHSDHPAPLGGGGARMACGVIN
ncbi:superoxide dismutase family protein [Thiopseudomonas alkaliphila]|uniref:Superoxide dismutase [Cu-Zn] n=1 Tax=Thiopseudomonas alkaliphila TaxID=1697053 RepID=A0AAW7DQA9_9GAMM|nr:superoxide dismutase [Cu-Zn] SodC [Thiopseudomonas alkaliphila]MDM1696345.1 superoxide dismutase family protein [Thiopseudomonas alkaliphila]